MRNRGFSFITLAGILKELFGWEAKPIFNRGTWEEEEMERENER